MEQSCKVTFGEWAFGEFIFKRKEKKSEKRTKDQTLGIHSVQPEEGEGSSETRRKNMDVARGPAMRFWGEANQLLSTTGLQMASLQMFCPRAFKGTARTQR